MADTINRRGRGGEGADGASTVGGASSTTGNSVASRAVASLADGTGDDGPSTVLVKTAAAAEDLVRAEAELSSKLRTAIRGSGASKGKRPGAPGGKGSEQVARSLAKRRQARLEMARLRSSSAFVDWLWLGNTDRPDKIKGRGQKGSAPGDAKTAPLPTDGVELAGGAGLDITAAGAGASASAAGWVAAGDAKLGSLDATSGAASPGASGTGAPDGSASAGASGTPATGRTTGRETTTPKQWTGAGEADGRVRRVKPDPMRPRRGSLGATAVDQILSEFDKHRDESDAAGRPGRGPARGRNAKGVRGGGQIKAMGGSRASAGASGDGKSAKPKNEQAPERGNVHARIAAKRRHVPDGGCARCWAVSTRCCSEAWELRQARVEATRAGLVLTGRAQEAVEVLGLTQGQVRRLHQHFVDMDDGLEGRIHLNDFFEDFLEMPRSAVTDAIWLALVENTTGQMLGFEDFVLMVCVYSMFTEEDILRFCFSTFDVNGNGDLDEDEFRQMLRIVNHEKPLFPGSFKSALEQFDTDANGVITFDEFLTMHRKFPLLLWPLFQLQDRMQLRSLSRREWMTISRRDTKMRAANQHTLKTKDSLVAGGATGLARIEEMDVEDMEDASARGSVRGGAAAAAAEPMARPMAPGQRLAAGGDITGVAMRSAPKGKVKSGTKKGKGGKGGKGAKSGKGGRR